MPHPLIIEAQKEAAAQGAAFLDEKRPNWWLEIDPATLNMSACHRCILGQLFGEEEESYEEGLSELGLDVENRDPYIYGFDLDSYRNEDGTFIKYDADYYDRYGTAVTAWDSLRDCWVDEIKGRVERGQLS